MSQVFIDPDLLPRERLAECFRSVLHAPGLRPFYEAQGHQPLREAIARRLRQRGIDVEAAEVLITAGSQQALDVVARALAERRIAVEDPVYSHARSLFANLGAEIAALPLDPFRGLDLPVWEARLRAFAPTLLYVISSFQNPTGYSYSSYELETLLRWSERTGFGLLEDDWGSDMLSGGEYRPTLRALGGPAVFYANSFTKKLLPSLRLGYLVASREAMPTLLVAKRIATLGNSPFLEAVLCEFLERGYYDTHLTRLQASLDGRYRACLEALEALMPTDVRWTTPGGGPTLWLEPPAWAPPERLAEALLGRGVLVERAAHAFAGAPTLRGFRLSYAYLTEATMREGLERLAEVLAVLRREVGAPRP